MSKDVMNISRAVRWALLGATSAGFYPAAIAQEIAATTVVAPSEEAYVVTVTARRRNEALQSTPLSISVLGADEVAKKGVASLADVAALTPGLQFDRGLSENDVRPVIRGISSLFGRPSVAILTDGIDSSGSAIVSNGGGGLMNARLLDLERVEVIRGPQSALYGRNAFAGAINYVTKRPTTTFQAGLNTEVGSDGLRDVGGFVSGPIIEEVLRGRLNVNLHDYDGAFTNRLTGNQTGKERSGGVRGQLMFTPSREFDALLRLEYSKNRQAQGAAVLNTYNAVTPAGYKYYKGDVSFDAANVKYIGDPTGLDGDTYRASLDLKHDLGNATLSSTTSYVNWDAQQFDDVGYSFLPALASGLSVRQLWKASFKTEQWAEDLRLASNGDDGLRWMVGTYGFSEKSRAIDKTEAYYASCSNPLLRMRAGNRCAGADGLPNAAFVNSPYGLEERKTTHYSLYGALGYDLTPKLKLSGELRVGHDRIEATHTPFTRSFALLGFASFTGGPFTAANFVSTGGYVLPGLESKTVDSSSVNPRISLDYAVNRDTLIYGSVAKGTKPGGVSQILGTERYDVNTYAPEKLLSYELGLKSETFAQRLTTNVALFYSRYTDQQTPFTTLVSTPTGGSLAVTGIANAGSVDTKGAELSTSFRASRNLDASLSWAYTVSRYDQFDSVDAAAKALLGGNLAGMDVPAVPRNSGSLQLRWRDRAWGDLSWFAQGTQTYMGKRHANGDAAGTIWLPQFQQTDAEAGLEAKSWTLTAYVRNLFQDDTPRSALRYVNVASASASDQAVIVFPATPRQFGLRLNYKF